MLTINDELNEYIHSMISPEDDVLASLNRQTWLDVVQPRMLSGHLQGKILEMISFMVKPSNILEIGTFTGYSAICLAKGLKSNGKLFTIELNDELEDFAKEYFKKSGMSEKIILYIGDALKIVPDINFNFDLVFIDGDKKEYSKYYETVFSKVNTGGFILVDNVLWDRKVVDPSQINDPETKSIIEFNKMIHEDHRVENVILPVRDGISVLRKKFNY